MRIIFVRHGHPDYKNDCLTELGHLHAKAAAKRLEGENIAKVYSSSCGRAYETAGYIAEPRGLTVEKLDFMREIGWGSEDGSPIFKNGHPWDTALDMVARGQCIMDPDWAVHEPFANNKVTQNVRKVSEGIDGWLASLGYDREGLYYRVRRENPETVVLTSHGGSSSAVLSHLFNLPFSFICAAICPNFTAVTILSFHGGEESLITPTVELLNDARHIADIRAENKYDR